MQTISGLTPSEFVDLLEPKKGDFKSWLTLTSLFDNAVLAEKVLKSTDADFYTECSNIAFHKAKSTRSTTIIH